MGISFDLTVEDLPTGILDRVIAGGYHLKDTFSLARWDGITVTEESWIINDLQVANNMVFLCGSYQAYWALPNADPGVGSGYLPDSIFFPEYIWRDGFFAAVAFDNLANPEAWHIIPCRNLIEQINVDNGSNALSTETGLKSMVIDRRTTSLGISEGSVYITAVGYAGVENCNLNGNFFPPPFQYLPYMNSIYDNQDFYPYIYTFKISSAPTLVSDMTPESITNPDFDGLVAIDQLGKGFHLAGLTSDPNSGPNSLDLADSYNLWGGIAVFPMEQFTYRGHEIGILFTPASAYSNVDPYGRSFYGFFCPTAYEGMFPIIKPMEFLWTHPGYQASRSVNVAQDLFNPESVSSGDEVHSDAHFWRRGTIPRRLHDVAMATSVPSLLDPNNSAFPFQTNQQTLGTLVFVGDCLTKSTCNTANDPATEYEPLVGYAINGYSDGFSWNQGVIYGYSSDNISLEDVATYSGGTNTSLVGATIKWVAPSFEIPVPEETSIYHILLGLEATNPENRAEILDFQPWLTNPYASPAVYVNDFKVIGPYASWDGIWETTTGLELPEEWTNILAQPRDFTDDEVANGLWLQNYKRYTGTTGVPTGRSQVALGFIDRTRTGPYMLAYDPGSIDQDINPSFNNFGQPELFQGQSMFKQGSNGGTGGPGPPELATWISPGSNSNQVYYHIINSEGCYPDPIPLAGFTWSGVELNAIDLSAIYPGATSPPPTYTYTTIASLVSELNTALSYVISAGPPFNQNTPQGVNGLRFAATSDGLGIYIKVDNAILVANGGSDPTGYGYGLQINEPSFFGSPTNYPYQGAAGINYPFIGTQAVDVEPLTVTNAIGSFLELGEQFNDAIGDSSTTRRPISGDYGTDRDQWIFTFALVGGGFSVVAATTDYSEILDQTDNFKGTLPEGLLFANRQQTLFLDGVGFGGTYYNPHGVSNDTGYLVTGTTGRNVKVFLNYMLYDELDALIAVEVANLGLRVTPENVLWYKTHILGQNADAEVTLEEINSWMAQQRAQYEELKRNRKPITFDDGGKATVKDFILDDESIEDLLPELTRLPPNPDSDDSDADFLGNDLSGYIKDEEEKRRETDN